MTTSPLSGKLEDTLTRWGISLAAAHYFGLTLNSVGNISYPANPGERRRILVSNPKPNQPKNFWDTSSKDLPFSALFHLAALEAHSHLYISNGEKSTMAMWTAGIPNVVNTFGEGNSLDEAVRLLQDHSTPHITVIPDCDKHGLVTAQKWQTRAIAAGISITLLDLRLYFAEQHGMSPTDYHKWDTRDLWLLLGQDKAAFHAALNALPQLDFARYAEELPSQNSVSSRPVKREYQTRTNSDDIDYKVANDEWWFNHVIPVLEQVAPLPSRGKHRHCPNPHHADKNPSFRLDEKSGSVFCTCGIHNQKKPRELVAAWVGAISWQDYKKQLREEYKLLQKQTASHTPQLENSGEVAVSETLYFEKGIPDSLRERLLRLHSFHTSYDDHASALLTYELWHIGIQQGLTTADAPITIDLLQKIVEKTQHQTTAKTLRRGVDQLVGLGFFAPIEDLPSTAKGRPTHQYAALTLPCAIGNFQQMMSYRLREYAYSDSIPDTITAEWFSNELPSIADTLAVYENHERAELYISHAQQRTDAEIRYERGMAKLEQDFAQDRLATERSTPLDNTQLPEFLPQSCLAWSNGRDYRDNYYREQALQRSRNARNITNRQAAQQIGVSEKTIRDVRDRVGVISDPQYKFVEINKPEKVRDQIDRAAPWAKNREYGRKVLSSSGAAINPNYENIDEWVALQINAGHQVLGRIQIAGLERLATPEELQFKQEDRLLKRHLKRRMKENREAKEERQAKEKARAIKEAEERKRALELFGLGDFVNVEVEDVEKPQPKPKRPRYRTMHNGFSPDYIEKQLALSQRDPEIIAAIRRGELFPFSPPITDSSNNEDTEKGNKSAPDDLSPPPDIGIPPDD